MGTNRNTFGKLPVSYKLLTGFMAPSALSSLATSPDITYEFDIFLSYHQKELALIRTVVEILKQRDVRFWWDKIHVMKGDDFQARMAEGLRNSRTTAVFLGPGEPGFWQTQEAELAMEFQRKRGNRVIPVLLPGCQVDDLPGFLGLRSAVDFSAGFENLEELESFLASVCAPARAALRVPTIEKESPLKSWSETDPLFQGIDDLGGALPTSNITFFSALASAFPR